MRALTLALTLTTALIAGPAVAGEWWIPAAAHADGVEGSVWRTDLVIHSFAQDPVTVIVALLPSSPMGPIVTVERELDPGASVVLEDVLWESFAVAGTRALVVQAPGDSLAVSSRTYNLSGSGTFGQLIPGVAAGALVAPGEPAFLLGLSGTAGRRTNLGWVNASGVPIDVMVDLIGANGDLLARREYAGEPVYAQHQLNDVFAHLGAAPQAACYARVTATGAFEPYASVVAGGSGDPIYVAAQGGLEMGAELVIPVAASAAGDLGTSWLTDAWVLNAGSQPATVELRLELQGGGAETAIVQAGPGQMLELVDLVGGTFGLEEVEGAVILSSDQLLLAMSRTFNTAPGGTFGQLIPAIPTAALGVVGETLRLPGARQDELFRTNLGLVAVGGSIEAELTLRGGDGQALSTATVPMAAGEQLQRRAAQVFGIDAFSAATVEVTAGEGSAPAARLAAYLSMVDNESSDPTFSLAWRGVAAEPDLDRIVQAAVTTAYVLGGAVEATEPRMFGGAAAGASDLSCVTTEYSGDTVRPGEAVYGKCWQATATFDQCSVEMPNAGYAFSQNGTAAADICILDGYESRLTADLETVIEEVEGGETTVIDLLADVAAILEFEDPHAGSALEGVTLVGELALTVDDAWVNAWGDLWWEANLTGYVFIPVGLVLMELPIETEDISAVVQVTVHFDGTEWALVQVRVGLWSLSFQVNLLTGEVVYATP